MAQEYKLIDIQIDKTPFVDNYGNEWLTAAFEGVSEPVRWVVKDKTKIRVGETYYGEVKTETSKAGKAYQRFHRESRPETDNTTPHHGGGFTQKREWQPRDDSAIQAQWAIGQAVQVALKGEFVELDLVEKDAKEFFAMIDRVKNSTPAENKTTVDAETQSLIDALPKEEEFDMSQIPF